MTVLAVPAAWNRRGMHKGAVTFAFRPDADRSTSEEGSDVQPRVDLQFGPNASQGANRR